MKVFVSSTTKDLGEARKKVCEQLLQLDIQPVSMDWYASDPQTPQQLDDDKVKGCDAVVIVVGHLYGSSPPGEDKSFTELEYEAAVSSGKEVFAFLASDEFQVPPGLRENDATRAKLQAFRKRLSHDHTPRPFNNADRLCAEVAAAVPKPTERAGRISVPKLPRPYPAHPYPIQGNFTGRVKERTMLTDWACGADSKPMLSLVGLGGLGKSALTWYWLHEDLPQEKLKLSGVIWWSFYEQEASFESFLPRALLYASGGTIDPTELPSDYDRMHSLWCILRDSPFLIVFDGAERLLRAYHALDAAYRGDDFNQEAGDNHLRCANPQAGQFLQWLASPGVKTRTLLTTRLHAKELNDLAGCRKVELEHLDPDDAVEFMRRQGVNGPRNAIVHACEPYGFLPLCLRLLSGAICKSPRKRGDINAAKGWRPPADLVRREHHILEVAYDTMAKDRRDLLSRIGAMRGPLDYDTAKVLSVYQDETELEEALGELEERGLLFRRQGQAHYDLHPIVRQYAYDRLGDKAATHQALKDYFDTVPQTDKVESLDELMPTIELFHHTIRAGGYEQALRIYAERLIRPIFYTLGAYDVMISLMHAFFPDGEDRPPRLADVGGRSRIMNDLAVNYIRIGENCQAKELLRQALRMNDEAGLPDRLTNLAGAQIPLGELKQAESNLRRSGSISISGTHRDKCRNGAVRVALGTLFTYMGRYDEANREFESALAVFPKSDDTNFWCMVRYLTALRALFMEEPKSALEALDRARQVRPLTTTTGFSAERDLVRILWLSGAAKRLAGDVTGCEVDLNDALSRCRRMRLVEHETDILLEMAKLQWGKAQRDSAELIEQAKALTREALESADRCEYRLNQADIHNFLAEMAFAEGDKAEALKHAEIAKERAWCDGPPYCYKKALDEAERMLAELA